MSLTRFRRRRGPGALTALAAVAALLASSLSSQVEAREGGRGPHHGPAAMFERADADGDGRVTMAELEDAQGARFAKMDADGDGALSLDELLATGHERAERRAARMLDRMDENGDGAISEAEFSALSERRAERMFERMDANGDGVIDLAEIEAAKAMRGLGHGPRDEDAAR